MDILDIAIAKSHTNLSLQGVGAIAGKMCRFQK